MLFLLQRLAGSFMCMRIWVVQVKCPGLEVISCYRRCWTWFLRRYASALVCLCSHMCPIKVSRPMRRKAAWVQPLLWILWVTSVKKPFIQKISRVRLLMNFTRTHSALGWLFSLLQLTLLWWKPAFILWVWAKIQVTHTHTHTHTHSPLTWLQQQEQALRTDQVRFELRERERKRKKTKGNKRK